MSRAAAWLRATWARRPTSWLTKLALLRQCVISTTGRQICGAAAGTGGAASLEEAAAGATGAGAAGAGGGFGGGGGAFRTASLAVRSFRSLSRSPLCGLAGGRRSAVRGFSRTSRRKTNGAVSVVTVQSQARWTTATVPPSASCASIAAICRSFRPEGISTFVPGEKVNSTPSGRSPTVGGALSPNSNEMRAEVRCWKASIRTGRRDAPAKCSADADGWCVGLVAWCVAVLAPAGTQVPARLVPASRTTATARGKDLPSNRALAKEARRSAGPRGLAASPRACSS